MIKYLFIFIINYSPCPGDGGQGSVAFNNESAGSICVGVGTHCTDGHIGSCKGVEAGTEK